jgi:hypothetical protein
MAAARTTIERVIATPRDLLVRAKAKALARAGYAPGAQTLDL